MVNGPPTPPATTPAELHDAAQSAAIPLEAEPSITHPPTDAQPIPVLYQQAHQGIGAAIARKDYQSAANIAAETDFLTASDRQQARMLIVSPLVLTYLITDNIQPARYALLRLPDNLSTLPLTRALTTLVICATNRQHAQLYEQAAMLQDLVSQPDFIDRDLGNQIFNLTAIFLDSFRQRTFNLLTTAYTSLPLPLACRYLGLQDEQTINAANANGWTFDSSTQILYPRKTSAQTPVGQVSSGYSSLNTLHLVADSVARLES